MALTIFTLVGGGSNVVRKSERIEYLFNEKKV